jgi:3-hydroxymyristoyl/3-hydroxydecanoyl-(acyl carrier protein) dehydratase
MVEDHHGERVVRFSGDDARCRGGCVPVWAILEAFAQAAGLTAFGSGMGGSLVQVNRFRCPRSLQPGDELALTVVVQKKMGPLVRARVSARRGGRLAAAAHLTLRGETLS